METPKFLRKYKLVFKVIKYVIGFIAMIMSKTDENNVINYITLDNRKSNLRELSKKDNATNTSVDKSKTGIRNVTIENGKYRVRIKGISFGYFRRS